MNLYRIIDFRIDMPLDARAKSRTVAASSSWTARTDFAEEFAIDITDVIARRIRIGDIVQVRDLRTVALAIDQVELMAIGEDRFATVRDPSIDANIRVPIACVEPIQ